MTTLKPLALILAIVATISTTRAQTNEQKDHIPNTGSSAIGFVYNPISGIRANSMFQAGDFIGNAIAAQAASPFQMFILGEPMISLRYKYKLSQTTAFRASIGFSGANFNYKEYVLDDILLKIDPLTTEQVEDIIHFNMIGGGINVGLEFSGGTGNLRFNGGVGIVYNFGGGSTQFTYGNAMTRDNPAPGVIQLVDSLRMSGTYYDINLAMARPTKRYNIGLEHAFGITFDLGLEWFFAKNLSVGAGVNFTPLIFAIQPETYSEMEGFSMTDNRVLNFTRRISSGSNYLLYGTENIGVLVSFNYYF